MERGKTRSRGGLSKEFPLLVPGMREPLDPTGRTQTLGRRIIVVCCFLGGFALYSK